jgi:hypothetical protein
MDASKITELRQKQNTVYIKRTNTVDSSTMIWRNQIQSSKYIKGVATCTGLQNTNVPTEPVCPNGDGTFSFGGGGKQMTLATGSTQQFPSVYRGAAGSAAEVYSSDRILLQKAGRQYCAELITDQDAYTIVPNDVTVNTNGPTANQSNPSVNNQDTNPYLPPFDTYYRFKNPQCSAPMPDKNLKHYVQYCDGCVVEPIVTKYGWPLFMVGSNTAIAITNSVVYNSDSVIVTGTFTGSIDLYDGSTTHTITGYPTRTLVSASTASDAFLIKYSKAGKILWVATMNTVTGTQTVGYSTIVDSTGIYVSGYFDGSMECYHRNTEYAIQPVQGTGVITLSTPSQSGLYLLKYSLDGYLLWSTMIDNVSTDDLAGTYEIKPTAMSKLCSDGTNIYLCNHIPAAATVYSSNGINPLTLDNSISLTTVNTYIQAILVQYTCNSGRLNWATCMTGDTTTTEGYSKSMGVICDANNVYMTGYFNTNITCYDAVTPPAQTFGAPRYTMTNGIDNGMFIMMYNKLGVAQWVNQGNTTSSAFVCNGIQLALDATGVYVVVPFPNIISLYNNPGGAGPFVQLINGASNYNLGIVKYTLTGTISWINKILDVDDNVTTNGFSIYSDGMSLYVTGGFGSRPIVLYNGGATNPTTSVATLNTAGGTNMNVFLVKYNLLGAAQWMTRIGRSGKYAYGYSVTSDVNIVYVSGCANGSIDLYNAKGLSQPVTIGASIERAANTYVYSYVAAFDYTGQVLLA